ncbi:hypothetical protein ACGF0J_24100 [Nonomuraea sp. NPDC047897]|uniref:hypothetical protein n=1 Tax=Nonomuraea sp. NPDC047897 TaxID=3364346 RepID=UPI0037145EB0
MKRLLVPLAAASLGATALALPAAAEPSWISDPLAPKPADAYSNAQFWLDANGAALKKATQYRIDAKDVPKLVRPQTQTGDGKPGGVAPTGTTPPSTKSKNVNLPKTIGKVFFLDRAGQPRWCSATSIQSRHRNLVATAGHCVYEHGKDVFRKWVFVPGYYQGKAPFGVYVGAYAFTAYDLDTYDDYDGDFAFVAVHNGFRLAGKKQVSKADFDKWAGDKWTEDVAIDEATYKKCVDLHGGESADCWAKLSTISDVVGPDYTGAKKQAFKEVSKEEFDKAPKGDANGTQAPEKTVLDQVTQSEYQGHKGLGYRRIDQAGNFTITHYFLKYWVKETAKTEYFKTVFTVGLAKDAGRLGDVVGGQGIAWNQPMNQRVIAFGYPSAPHPDGDRPFSGLTPKWCSGKTGTKTYQINTFRVETHQVLKCSMTPGADGGPWLVRYDNNKRTGYVNGVTSLFIDEDGNDRVDHISSAYFDGEVADVYAKANYAETKKIVGPNGELLPG